MEYVTAEQLAGFGKYKVPAGRGAWGGVSGVPAVGPGAPVEKRLGAWRP